MSDFLFRGSLSSLDPELYELTQLEAERQARKLIMVASESQSPLAVREALGSAFHNIYAEGYPDEDTRFMLEKDLLDYADRMTKYRRYSDPRYYKGVEYVDVAEALARRRCAELFSTNGVSADDIYVNVQALSGAPANNAVYHALVNPGDTIMGMSLLHGGHLSHGSPVNRSGKYYNAIHYTVDPQTERIDYEQILQLALKHRPKFVIAGYSSYPWSVDWAEFRKIADASGSLLFADIAHVAGLVAGGVFPSPVGYADVITFTTHKSLCGPRGACILTSNPTLARKIDRAVFPGEQGGPHVNVFLAMALAFKLASTEQFKNLQKHIVNNAIALTDRLSALDFRIPFGGTDTHVTNLDCGSIVGPDGTTLSGDQAARILDITGIVVNRNTIPGDDSAADPSGIRLGTPWVTQRGLVEADMRQIADVIAQVLKSTRPYSLTGRKGDLRRAKVDFEALESAKLAVRALAEKAGLDSDVSEHGYPHFYYIDDPFEKEVAVFELTGSPIRSFLNYALAGDMEALGAGDFQSTIVNTPRAAVPGILYCDAPNRFYLQVDRENAGLTAAWLRDLSDGYVEFDEDYLRKLPGPVIVSRSDRQIPGMQSTEVISENKPYYIGVESTGTEPALPLFTWTIQEGGLRRTPIYDLHVELSAKVIPFAGWEMPVWYSSVLEEHLAVREAAGLFDVAHMGVYQAEGPDAAVFLDSVVGNDILSLGVGDSCYTHFLDPDANVIDDLLVYRRGDKKYMLVVNASNDDKDWAWLNAVRQGRVRVDHERPLARAYGREVVLRNLRDPKEGGDMRVDIALQGPRSRDILLAMGVDDETRKRILSLKRTQLCDAVVGGFDLVVSRTGYTGEKMAFELFVHPQRARELFTQLLERGEKYGLKPIGLGARDSLRTEAGLPLYGHEMGGEKNLGVGQAGFGTYVKTYKPWFIGRKAYLEQEESRNGVVVRFRFLEKGVRMAHSNDPVMDKRGRVIGWVTSCAIDTEGFLTGQAYVDLKSSEESASLFIYQSAPDKPGKAPAQLQPGDRVGLPGQAVVIRRFPG